MSLDSLRKLYVEELQDLHSAENQILDALPRMAEKASSSDLSDAFQEHRRQTEEQVRRLETIFDDLGEKAGGRKCKGIAGIISEGDDMMGEDMDDDVRDAALISAGQRVEHYEMAAYGTVRTYARELGLQRHAELLQRTLDEEGQTDRKLTSLAERRINDEARS